MDGVYFISEQFNKFLMKYFIFLEFKNYIDDPTILNKTLLWNNLPYLTHGLAGIHAFLGERKEAYDWLRKYESYVFIWGFHKYILIDQLFESLWEDEEFKAIIQRQEKKFTLQPKLKCNKLFLNFSSKLLHFMLTRNTFS